VLRVSPIIRVQLSGLHRGKCAGLFGQCWDSIGTSVAIASTQKPACNNLRGFDCHVILFTPRAQHVSSMYQGL